MYNIITNLLVLLQVQQKIISILFLLVTAKPLKSKSSDKPANVPYRKLVIDQMPIFDTCICQVKNTAFITSFHSFFISTV